MKANDANDFSAILHIITDDDILFFLSLLPPFLGEFPCGWKEKCIYVVDEREQWHVAQATIRIFDE